MASLGNFMAATRILAENSANLMGAISSKAKVDRVGFLDVKKDVDGSVDAADVDKETVYSSMNLVRNLIHEGCSGTSVLGGGIDARVGLDGDSSWTDNMGGGGGGERSKEEGRINLNADVKSEGRGVGRWNGERLEDQNHGFRVGDFVWGKIKSHPWWPGQVHDPTNASDFALKHSLEGHILVAFFGDGSCSWCLPSQLIPFIPNLDEKSTESPSKNFVNAVKSAVDEIGRIVESKITCKCVPLEKRAHLARPMVANAGVRAGVLAPEVETDRLLVPEYEPAEILAKLTDFARRVSVVSVIDIAILRSWISAYYIAKRGYNLAVYSEPVLIEGLEDRRDVREGKDDGKSASVDADAEIGGSKGGERGRKRSGGSLVVKQDTVEVSPADSSTKRERKKSKFLSAPYTNLDGMMVGSKSDELIDDKAVHVSAVDVEVDELLQKLEFGAADCFYLRKEGYLDSTLAFISAHRSSTYVCVSDREMHHKCRRVSHKRKSSDMDDDLISDARAIRRKMDKMGAMLEACCSRFSSDEKSWLKHELKHLMENVETAGEKVRVLAENNTDHPSSSC